MEALVTTLGGRVTHTLPIIKAFAAEIPGRAVPFLARNPGVRWLTLNAEVEQSSCSSCVDTSALQNAYIKTIGADRLWAEGIQRKTPKFSVAVVDSGMANSDDLSRTKKGGKTRVIAQHNLTPDSIDDDYGHGSHIAGIIGGNGTNSQGRFIGVAPMVQLVNVKVSNAHGMATTADVVAGLQWIYEHRDTYNIRVVSISLNSSVAESYHTSPLNAAVEFLWFRGIVVVVSAGNGVQGAMLTPPANDPFVITVGASDDRGTSNPADDTVAPFSAYGTTVDGFRKPDLVAPGTNIVSILGNPQQVLATEHPTHVVEAGKTDYFRMSGTSMSAPVVAGVVALLLENEPRLTPAEVKARLLATARSMRDDRAGAGLVDAYAAVRTSNTGVVNERIPASRLIWGSNEPAMADSANWGSANWGSANWGSANWGSANWGSTYWEP